MHLRQGRAGFTLAELLVVIAIIGILASFLLPVITKARHAAKVTLASAMLSSLEVALADYFKDHGVYPPEKAGVLDKCSETLYFYLAGADVDAPAHGDRDRLQAQRATAKVYFDFKKDYIDDIDRDGRYEALDPWGQPWIYVRGQYPGKETTWSGLGNPNTHRPFHRKTSYDLYSVGPDGQTGSDWESNPQMTEWGPDNPNSFYKQAGDERIDGEKPDDIANF